jgi:beta-glucanase (GH16 family)
MSRRRAAVTIVAAVIALLSMQVVASSGATADTTTTTTASTTWLCGVLHIGCPTTTTSAPVTTSTTAPTTTTGPTVPTTAVASDCGGQPTVAKPGGGTWSCTFSDEFDGSTLDPAKWIPTATTDPDGWAAGTTLQDGINHGDGSCIVNSPETVHLDGGRLRLTALQTAQPVTCKAGGKNITTRLVTGEVSTWHRHEQAFGRWEIRAQLPPQSIRGLQTSFWMWPNDVNRYPESSEEIDVAEMYSQWPERVIPYIHYSSLAALRGIKSTNQTFISPTPLDEGFHTYVLEWTETNLTITFDGAVVLDHPIQPNALPPRQPPAPFDGPFFLNLMQGFGVGTGNAYRTETPIPATTQVDYVRVWG